MANNQTDVELRIRATNYSKKTTTEVTTALKDLVKAEEAQIEASKRGAASASDLEKGYERIASAVKALVGQQSVIKLFQNQSAAVDELKAKLESARKAQADYAKYVADSGRQTPAQTKAMKDQAAAVTQLEKDYTRLEAKLASAAATARQYGVNAGNAAQSQQAIVTAVTAANAALERQEAAMRNADGYAKLARDARLAAEATERVANARMVANDAARQAAIALAAQKRAEQEVAAVEAMRNVQHQADMEALFTREANKRTEAIRKQAEAMRAAAADAERLMRRSDATARGTAPVSAPNLNQRLTDIAQPSQAAVRDVQGLTASISDLTAKVAAINGPVKNYRDVLLQAQEAQKALSNMGSLIDSYNRQIAVIRAARTEYVEARTAVSALIAQMRAGGGGDDITTRLARAQGTLERSANSLGNLTTQARATQAALRAAGIDTNNLTAAEAQLVNQAQRATGAMNQLTDAYRRNGAAAENAGSSIFRWFGGANGRTTLSYAQRLRGELLGIATAFVGVNAVIGLAKKTIDAYNTSSAILARLTIVAGGDTAKAAEEFAYLEKQADRIGFVFNQVAPAYAKFAIAMTSAGFTTQETRFAFEQIAGSAVKARLSTDELSGVLKAFEQMASKGKIQAEELRGQLGDRLPGAFQIAARAAGKTVEEYTKMMELGEVGSDQVLAIARELGKTYGAAQQGATTLLVAQARFENASNRFLTQVANGGFIDAYQRLLERLTTFLNDGSADKIAQTLSSGFVVVIDVLQVLVENLNLVKFAIGGILVIKFISWLTALPVLIRAFTAELVLANAALLTMQARLNAASAAVALSTALGAGGLTGVALRLAPALIGVGNALLFVVRSIPLLLGAYAAFEAGRALIGAFKDETDRFDEYAPAVRGAAEREDEAMRKAAEARAKWQKAEGTKEEAALKLRYERLNEIAISAVAARTQAEKAEYDRQQALKGAQDGSTTDPGAKDTTEKDLKRLQDELAKGQKKIDRQMQNERLKAAKGDLAARLDLVDQEFDAQRDAAKERFKDQDAQNKAIEMINKASLAKQAVERAKYNNEQAKKDKSAGEQREKLEADIGDSLRDLQAKLNGDLAAQKGTSLPIVEQLKAADAEVDKTFTEIEKKIRRFASLDPVGAKAALDAIDGYKQQAAAIASTNVFREQANKLTEEFNKKQKVMQTNIGSIQSQVDNGQKTVMAGTAEINEQLALLGPGVQEAGNAALDFATKYRNMLDPVRFAEITSNIRAGLAQSGVDAQTAANNVIASQRVLNSLLEAEQREREQIELERSLNLRTSAEAADALNENAVKYQGSILKLTQDLLGFIGKARETNAMSVEDLDKIEASAQRIATTTGYAKKSLSDLGTTFQDSIVSNGVTAFDAVAESLAKVALGQQSIGQGFRNMGVAAAQFFASLLRDIASAIIKQQILNALMGWSGTTGGAGTAAIISTGVFHSGGNVSSRGRSRNVSAAAFIGAEKFHEGGLPGLKANEVPAILERGERVLSKEQVRNGVGSGGAAPEGGAGLRVVLVDDRARVPEAMSGADGARVIVQAIKANAPTIKTLLGVRG